MSNIPDNPPLKDESSAGELNTKLEAPHSRVKGMLEDLEMFAIQRGSQSNIDISKFNDGQRDKLLDILSQNEKNAFDYHSKRIDAIKEIECKRIDASIVNQRTLRFLIIAVIIVIPILTILILFFKETFFIPWLTFLTGILGGVGISKIIPAIYKQPHSENPIEEEVS